MSAAMRVHLSQLRLPGAAGRAYVINSPTLADEWTLLFIAQRDAKCIVRVKLNADHVRMLNDLCIDALVRRRGEQALLDLVLTLGNRAAVAVGEGEKRSEEHTSELQSLMRISYAVFCLKKKTNN